MGITYNQGQVLQNGVPVGYANEPAPNGGWGAPLPQATPAGTPVANPYGGPQINPTYGPNGAITSQTFGSQPGASQSWHTANPNLPTAQYSYDSAGRPTLTGYAAPASVAATSGASTSDPYGYLTNESPEAIRQRYRSEFEKFSANLDEMYRAEYDAAAQTRARNQALAGTVLTKQGAVGLQTPFEMTASQQIGEAHGKEVQAINARKQAALQQAMMSYKQMEQTDINAQREIAAGNMDRADKLRAEAKADAEKTLAGLAVSGRTWDELKADPAYQNILKTFGGNELMAQGIYMSALGNVKPIHEERTQDGKLIRVFFDPGTGKTNRMEIDLGIPLTPQDQVAANADGSYTVTKWSGEPGKSKVLDVYYVDSERSKEERALDRQVKEAQMAASRASAASAWANAEQSKAEAEKTRKETAAVNAGQASSYLSGVAGRMRQFVDDIIQPKDGKPALIDQALATGWTGVATSWAPGTPGYELNRRLVSLKSNISIQELAKMREASKTGGALGNVTERELDVLQSSMGALTQGDAGILRESLIRIGNSADAILSVAGATQPGGQTSAFTTYQGQQYPNTMVNNGKKYVFNPTTGKYDEVAQ